MFCGGIYHVQLREGRMNTTDKINQLRQRLSEAQLHSRRLHDQYMMAMAQECRIRERIEDLLSMPHDLKAKP